MTANIYKSCFIVYFMKRNKEDIKSAILDALDEKPLFVQQLSEKISSNWLTVKEALDELVKELRVRCLLSTDKIKVYMRTDYPVYYGIPLKKEIREQTIFILSEIIKQWKNKNNGEVPKNTSLQKTAVDVIKECNLNLPALQLHYGMVTAISARSPEQLSREIRWSGSKKESEVIECIAAQLKKHTNRPMAEEDNQYEKYNLNLHKIRKKIKEFFRKKGKKDYSSLEDLLFKLLWCLPSDYPEIYNLADRYVSSCVILLNTKNSGQYGEEIQESLDVLWDLITTSIFFKDIFKFISEEDLQLFGIIKSFNINSRLFSFEEQLNNLKSISDEINPEDIKVPMDEESIEVRRIMTESLGRE